MTNIFKNFDAKKTGIFAGGVLFGTAGIKILASDDAKKFYANCTAAVLRAKSCVAEAQQINEEREAKAAVVEDEEVTETAEETEETEEEDFTEA